MMTPTKQIYGALEMAFAHFNRDLFDNSLPPALLTLQRKGTRTMGYFSPMRFRGRKSETTTDEIAMNPKHFGRSLEETLDTLVHEMVHLWQQHFDSPSRGGYHNKRWAMKMKEIGLQPTNTGKPGGKETGQKMTDYPIAGGAFEVSCRKLVTAGFDLVWAEAIAEIDGPDVRPLEDDEKGRIRWICPVCEAKAWAKPSAVLGCYQCHQALIRG